VAGPKHGPYNHVFSLPRDGQSKQPGFHRLVGMTPAELRGATKALTEIEFLSRISPQREQRRLCDPPVQFAVGPDFALLFAGSHKKNSPFKIEAPLFVATYKNPIPRPMRFDPPRPKDDRDLALARLAALKPLPVPLLSANVLKAFMYPSKFNTLGSIR
jgi:hypothetical protein